MQFLLGMLRGIRCEYFQCISRYFRQLNWYEILLYGTAKFRGGGFRIFFSKTPSNFEEIFGIRRGFDPKNPPLATLLMTTLCLSEITFFAVTSPFAVRDFSIMFVKLVYFPTIRLF